MVLIGYGNIGNSLRVWERVDLAVCHSDCKLLHQRLLPEIHQFSEPDR